MTVLSPFVRRRLYWIRVPRIGANSVQRSLGTEDKTTAQHMAVFLGHLVKQHEKFLLDQLAEGRTKIAEAYAAWVDRSLPQFIADLKSGGANDPLLEPQVARWVGEMARRQRPSAEIRGKYERQVRTLIVPGFTRSQLTRPTIRQWLQDLPVQQPNRYRAALSSFCQFLVLDEILEFNPVSGVPASKEAAPRDRHLNVAEATALVAAMPTPLERAFQAFLICTAADVESALQAAAGDIGKGRVHVRGTKQVWRDRTCYVTSTWAPLWDQYIVPIVGGGSPLFADLGDYDTIWKSFRRVCALIGLEDYTMKDHRHTWAVQAFKDRLPIHAIYQQLGHRDATMALRVYGKHQSRAEDYRMGQVAVGA